MAKSMTAGSPAKSIFMFTLPLIAGNIFQQLYIFVDTLIVGRTIGVNALAAVGSTGSLMFLMIGLVIGVTTGFSILTGQRFGAGDQDGIRQSVAACAFLSIIITVLLTAFGFLSAYPLLVLMQTPPEIIDEAYQFIVVIYAGIGATVLFNMLSNLIRALGDSRTPLFFLIFASVLNIVLELLFILTFGWGVAGAAAATVVAQAVAGLLCIAYIAQYLPVLHLARQDWKIDKSILWQHIRIGIPMGFQASIIAIGAIVLQVALNNLGADAIAAYAAAQKIDMIAGMPMMSFGMAMATYTAQNYGANNFERIRQGVRQCVLMSVSFSIIVGAFNMFFGSYMTEWFVGDQAPAVVELAQVYLNINGSCYWILALLFIYRYTLQGLGQSLIPTFAGIMELIMRVFAALVMAKYFGFAGVSMASPLAWIGSAVPLMIAYYFFVNRLVKQKTNNLQ